MVIKRPSRPATALLPITEAAADLGFSISSKTGIRWALHGRNGRKLPTLKAGGRRLTTVSALLAWLRETESPRARPLEVCHPVDSDAVLEAHGLPREETHSKGGG